MKEKCHQGVMQDENTSRHHDQPTADCQLPVGFLRVEANREGMGSSVLLGPSSYYLDYLAHSSLLKARGSQAVARSVPKKIRLKGTHLRGQRDARRVNSPLSPTKSDHGLE